MNARRAIGGWLVRLGQRIARPTVTEVPVNSGISRDIATTEQLIQDAMMNPNLDEAARSMNEWKRRWLARAGGIDA